MFKLRVVTLASLMLLAIGLACELPAGTDGTEDFSIEDAIAAGATIQAVSVASAVEATLQASAVEATILAVGLEATLQAMASEATATSGLVSLSPSPVV